MTNNLCKRPFSFHNSGNFGSEKLLPVMEKKRKKKEETTIEGMGYVGDGHKDGDGVNMGMGRR